MLAASVILALFANTFATPSSIVGVGAAETRADAKRNRVVESFIADESQHNSMVDVCYSIWRIQDHYVCSVGV